MKEISSLDNPIIRKTMGLAQKKQRDKQGCYLIEGPNLLREALKNDIRLEAVLFRSSCFTTGEKEEYTGLLDSLKERQADFLPELLLVSDSVFDRAAQTQTPQGVMAIAEKKSWTEEEFFGQGQSKGSVLVLDRLQDPGNLGTVLRTADGAGFLGAVLMKGCGDIYSPKVARACAGTLFRLPVLFCGTPEEAMRLLAVHGKKVYATALEDSRIYYKCDLRENVALVIGNEGNGVCSEFLRGAVQRITIPMDGNQESLNAAVAAGILMYEIVRQRNGG